MSRRAPRLKFTEEELSDLGVQKAANKAEKQIGKLEKAEARIPQKKVVTKQRPPPGDGGKKVVSSIHFEEKKAPSRLSHAVKDAPLNAASVQFHRQVEKSEEENVGVESAHHMAEYGEVAGRTAVAAYRSHKLRPYRIAAQAERKADRANLKALNRQRDREGAVPHPSRSRWYQRRAIKKEYAAAKRAAYQRGTSVPASHITGNASRKAVRQGKRQMGFVRRHGKGFLVLIALFLLLAFLLNTFSACSVLLEGVGTAVSGSAYPSLDGDMLEAEMAYCALENELRNYLDHYEDTHSYDAYEYDLDAIEHDPYVLISMLTALHHGPWTIADVHGTLQLIFDRQYVLTEEVRTEPGIDDEGNPCTITTCTVTLENNDLSSLTASLMDEETLAEYAAYMAVLGNRPDLFPGSPLIERYMEGTYPGNEYPPEALADARFAAMIREGEKYLGYPYVWGGASPSTSFDCSGFVSWVINHSGWNVGRLTAQGLCNICTPVSSANARPGDLVFFKGTYRTNGVSHVGIYVGNSQMLHCGDPISYANLNSNYWRQHFYQFGRLP